MLCRCQWCLCQLRSCAVVSLPVNQFLSLLFYVTFAQVWSDSELVLGSPVSHVYRGHGALSTVLYRQVIFFIKGRFFKTFFYYFLKKLIHPFSNSNFYISCFYIYYKAFPYFTQGCTYFWKIVGNACLYRVLYSFALLQLFYLQYRTLSHCTFNFYLLWQLSRPE
jgi:hypothetical protein